jgi:hypothetical protein
VAELMGWFMSRKFADFDEKIIYETIYTFLVGEYIFRWKTTSCPKI